MKSLIRKISSFGIGSIPVGSIFLFVCLISLLVLAWFAADLIPTWMYKIAAVGMLFYIQGQNLEIAELKGQLQEFRSRDSAK